MAGVTYECNSTYYILIQTQKYILYIWLKISASNNIIAQEMVREDLILAEKSFRNKRQINFVHPNLHVVLYVAIIIKEPNGI